MSLLGDVYAKLDAGKWRPKESMGQPKPKEPTRYFILAEDERYVPAYVEAWASENEIVVSGAEVLSLHGYRVRELKNVADRLRMELLGHGSSCRVWLMNGSRQIGRVNYEMIEGRSRPLIVPILRDR